MNQDSILDTYNNLHSIAEYSFQEVKTAEYLAQRLSRAGYAVQTKVAETGVVGNLSSRKPGPVLALRADLDALRHNVNGRECVIHSCGHDAHSTMVLTVAEEAAKRGLDSGTLKIIFQPAEETLSGARRMVEAGVIEDIDMILGIHLRPAQEALRGQVTPALNHASSYILEAVIIGRTAHGGRPHLGINVLDAVAAIINAVNAIHTDPVIPASIKVTKVHAGGAALNAIPDRAEIALDLRAQTNALMEEMIAKAKLAIEIGASSVGATAVVSIKSGAPAAEYDTEMIELAKEAILNVLGKDGLLSPIITPGAEDFHFFVKHKPSIKAGYIGLGCNLLPGLHHPDMSFDTGAMLDGVKILLYMTDKILGLKK